MLSNLAQPTTPSGQAVPVTAHRLFPVMVATWFAVLFGIGSLVVPTALVELLVVKSGFSSLMAAAAPPLGATARGLVALGGALVGGGLGFMLARKVAANGDVSLPAHRSRATTAHELAAHDEAPVRRPIMAREELGSDTLDAPTEDTGLLAARRPSIPGRRRGLTTETEDAPLEVLAHAAQANGAANEEAEQSQDLAEPSPRSDTGLTEPASPAEPDMGAVDLDAPQEALDLESFVSELHNLATPRDEDDYNGGETKAAPGDDELPGAPDIEPGFAAIAEPQAEGGLEEDGDAPLVFVAPSLARMREPGAEDDGGNDSEIGKPADMDTAVSAEPEPDLTVLTEDTPFDTRETQDAAEQPSDASTLSDDWQPGALAGLEQEHTAAPLAATMTGPVAAIATAPLDTLGTVALAERLGLSLRRRMEQKARASAAGEAELPQPETAEGTAAPGLHGFTALRTGIAAAPGVAAVPAALRPLDLVLGDEDEDEDDDGFDSFGLTLPRHTETAFAPAPDNRVACSSDDEESGGDSPGERANSVETEHALRNALATLQRISGAA